MRREIFRMERVTYKEAEVTRLEDFNLQIYEGEIMGMVPFNGYGMSDFLELLQTNIPIYDGYIYYNGELVNSWKKSSGMHNRIGVIQAKSSLVETMTITDNVFVMRPGFKQELIRTKLLNRQLQPFLKEIGIEIPADTRIENLSVFQRIVIELLRAVVMGSHLIVLEEVGALISYGELEQLHEIIRHYAAKGFSFLYICPHFEEVNNICDRAAMLTNGRIWKVVSKDMMSREVREVYYYTREYDKMVRSHLKKRELNEKKPEEILKWKSYSEAVGKEISFPIYRGEYLAIQIHESRILQEMSDALCEKFSGDAKVSVIQESPTVSMIFPELDYTDNLCMALSRRMGNLWRNHKIRHNIRKEYGPKLGDEVFEMPVDSLSEKQKYQLVYSRVMLQNPQIVFCIRPFKGADLTHRMVIWKLLEEFLEKGITVVDLSLNLSDSLSLADRFLLIQTNGCVREIKKEEFATISRQIPWRHLYRE